MKPELKIDISEAEETRRGELLAKVLGLKPIRAEGPRKGQFNTDWGTKTALGLFRTVHRIVLDGE